MTSRSYRMFQRTLIAGCLLIPALAQAQPFRVNQVPNGTVNSCLTCHLTPAGGLRNSFGTTIETSFLTVPGPSGNVIWNAALASIDSDGDGRSNGTELLDPGGAWSIGATNPGSPALVTNPGVKPPGVPALGSFAGLLGVALVGLGRRAFLRLARR